MRSTKTGRFDKTHDMSWCGEYAIWGNMHYRCNTPSSPLYKNYGGRGIYVCGEWKSFESFIDCMGLRPTKDHSLDRIDVDGGYCPENCRWATKKEQSRNRRNSSYILVDGQMLQVDDFCERYGLKKSAIKNRIRRGWSDERIISTPVRGWKQC